MIPRTLLGSIQYGVTLTVAALCLTPTVQADRRPRPPKPPAALQLTTGQFITPTAARGAVQQMLNPGLADYPDFVAGQAVRSQLSPDGETLAVLCAGHNSLFKPDGTTDTEASTQFIFLYDVSGKRQAKPVLKQVIQQTNAHVGLVFAPDGSALYVTGGKDDVVYVYAPSEGAWSLSGTIGLGHEDVGMGRGVNPNASGLGISADGKTLVVANNYNDSISVIDTASGSVRYEHDLRPYFAGNEGVSGGVGGTYPFGVAVYVDDKGKGKHKHKHTTAYVSSARDREVVVVDISSPSAGRLVKRIKLDGNGLGVALDPVRGRLYVAQDNADQVAVIDTQSNEVVARIDARGPEGLLPSDGQDDQDDQDDQDGPGKDKNKGKGGERRRHTGAATFAVTLSPDGSTLYAVNSGANSVAVIRVREDGGYEVRGLVPTAYEPRDVALSADGQTMYIVNGKSMTGPNPGHLASSTGSITSIPYPEGAEAAAIASKASNQYQFQLERASLVSAPVPDANELERLTTRVAANNFYTGLAGQDRKTMQFLRDRIKHIIYVVKENRTFDQVLGDLDNGANGDSSLTQFGTALTPNQHRLATAFVTLDNFMDPGDGSMDGWSWTLQGRVTNTEAITQQINYASVSRGLSYDSEGNNRNVAVNWASVAERDMATGPDNKFSADTASLIGGTENVLPGTGNHASADAPFGTQEGYIFSAVLNAGGSVRNYGMLVNNIGSIGSIEAPIADPFGAGEVQVAPLEPSLANMTDVYFRGYDQNYPDLWRYHEWKREFDQYVAHGDLPSLSMVRFSHDHMGAFGTALGGVNTPETQQADHDLSVGLLVQSVAQSCYADDTLVILIEDDCQDGPDHVDSHRATAYIVGPYVKQGAVISQRYSQVNALRTIEDILGAQHINLNTAYQRPMAEVFDIDSSGKWSFVAEASTVLQSTELPAATRGLGGVAYIQGEAVKPRHAASYWAKLTAGYDFSDADRVSPAKFNRILWKGLMGRRPFPTLKGQRGAKDDD